MNTIEQICRLLGGHVGEPTVAISDDRARVTWWVTWSPPEGDASTCRRSSLTFTRRDLLVDPEGAARRIDVFLLDAARGVEPVLCDRVQGIAPVEMP